MSVRTNDLGWGPKEETQGGRWLEREFSAFGHVLPLASSRVSIPRPMERVHGLHVCFGATEPGHTGGRAGRPCWPDNVFGLTSVVPCGGARHEFAGSTSSLVIIFF